MRFRGLVGAGLFVGLGLDCASAPRFIDRAQRLTLTGAIASAPLRAEPERGAEYEEGTSSSAAAGIAPATRYASLSHEGCAAELAARSIVHEALAPRLGIRSPVRLRGPLSGVTFRTLWPEVERARTSFEICDCRLVLALDDFAKLLRTYAIVDVMYFSAYRPPPAGWSEPEGLRHEGGLAIDIGYFRKADGSALNVEADFVPRPHERICAPGNPPPPRDATMSAIELRKIACDAAAAQLFHLALTPAYDRVHRDHFHLEVTPGKTDFVAR